MKDYHDNLNAIKKSINNKSNDSSVCVTNISHTNTDLCDLVPSSVIYIGHLPPEFQENEIHVFFSQFGYVTNIHLSRSQRTLRSRGYAFVKFSEVAVASIAAQTMNGYLLMGERKIVSHVLTNERVHPNLFRNKRLHSSHNEDVRSMLLIQRKNIINQVNCSKDPKKIKRAAERLLRAEKKKRRILLQLDINFDYPGYFSSSYCEKKSHTEFLGTSGAQSTTRNVIDYLSNTKNLENKNKKTKPNFNFLTRRTQKKKDLESQTITNANNSLQNQPTGSIHETFSTSLIQKDFKKIELSKLPPIEHLKKKNRTNSYIENDNDGDENLLNLPSRASLKSYHKKSKFVPDEDGTAKKMFFYGDLNYKEHLQEINRSLPSDITYKVCPGSCDSARNSIRYMCDQSENSSSMKGKTKPIRNGIKRRTDTTNMVPNVNIQSLPSPSYLTTNMSVKNFTNTNHRFRDTVSRHGTFLSSKDEQVKELSFQPKHSAANSIINKVANDQLNIKNIVADKEHKIELSETYLDSSLEQLSPNIKIASSMTLLKSRNMKVLDKQKKLVISDLGNNTKKYASHSDILEKKHINKLKLSTDTFACELKSAVSNPFRTTKIESNKEKMTILRSEKKKKSKKKHLEKLEVAVLSSTKNTDLNEEIQAKLRRSKRMKK